MDLTFRAQCEPFRRGGPLTGSTLCDGALGLAALADSTNEGSLAAAASQLVLDTLHAHVALHRDLLDRVAQGSADGLRARLAGVVQEACGRAAKEAYALGRRRNAALAVSLDMALFAGDCAVVGHLGDGAVFLLRRGLLHRLSSEPVVQGEAIFLLPPVGAKGARVELVVPVDDRPPVPEGLGADPHVSVDVQTVELHDGDRIIFASGGPCAALSDEQLLASPGDRRMDELLELLGARVQGATNGRSALFVGVGVGTQLPPARPDPEAEARARLAVLGRMPLFAHCTEAELRSTAGVTRPRTYRHGALVLSEGQPGEGIYLLVAGEAEILKDGKEIARLHPGSNFGEMSMLDDPRASATVRAATDVELLVISREAFFRLLRGNPTFAVKILWNMLLRLSHNLRMTSARLVESAGEPGQS